MTFEEWTAGVSEEIRGDSLWKEEIVAHRMRLLGQIIRLLLTMIPEQHGRVLRESTADYDV